MARGDSNQTFSIWSSTAQSGQDLRLPLLARSARLTHARCLADDQAGRRFLWGRALTRGGGAEDPSSALRGGGDRGGRPTAVAAHTEAQRTRSIATTERYLHANVAWALWARNSALEGRSRAKAVEVRPAMEQIMGELREMVGPRSDGSRTHPHP